MAVADLLASETELRGQVVDNIIPPSETVDNAVLSLPTGGVRTCVVGVVVPVRHRGIVFSTYDTLNHLAAVPRCERLAFIPRYEVAMLAVLLVSVVAWAGSPSCPPELPDVAGFPAHRGGVLAIAFAMLFLAPTLLVAGRRRPVAATCSARSPSQRCCWCSGRCCRHSSWPAAVYGSFATIVGLFALLFACQVLVYAAEVAVVRRACGRAPSTPGPDPADERALTLLAQMSRTAPERVGVRFERPSRWAGPPASSTRDDCLSHDIVSSG